MLDSFVVGPRNQGCHRDDILGIVVGYSFKRPELPLAGLVVSDNVGSLNIHAMLVFDADEIYLTGKQLPYVHFVPVVDELVINDAFNDLFNVSVPVGVKAGVANAVVLKVILAVRLQEFLSADIEARDFSHDVCIAKVFEVLKDQFDGYRAFLPLHIIGNTGGRYRFPRAVGKETDQVVQERHIPNLMLEDYFLDKGGVQHVLGV